MRQIIDRAYWFLPNNEELKMNKVKTVYIVNLIHLMLIETVYMLAIVFYIFFWRVLVNLEHIQKNIVSIQICHDCFLVNILEVHKINVHSKNNKRTVWLQENKHTFFFSTSKSKDPTTTTTTTPQNKKKCPFVVVSPLFFFCCFPFPREKKNTPPVGDLCRPQWFSAFWDFESPCASPHGIAGCKIPPFLKEKIFFFGPFFQPAMLHLPKSIRYILGGSALAKYCETQ